MLTQEELVEHIATHAKKVWCAVQKIREGTLPVLEMWETDRSHLLLKYYLTTEGLPETSEIWFAKEVAEAYELYRKHKIRV